MKYIADFHIHSKFSRACSPNMDLEHLAEESKIKGIKVMATGDFTHPVWFANLRKKLIPAEQGLFKLKQGNNKTRFILSSEISCIYSKAGKVRKIHMVILAPSFKAVEKINSDLEKIGNLKADGRPILGLDAKELLKIALNADKNCFVIPAHIWTPWFSLFGFKSGFDTVEECFEDYSKYIFAMETGLSSDPAMNWRISALDKFILVSNSDAHSPAKIGREANIFNTELSYNAMVSAIKNKDLKKFLGTLEFFPEEGKYHFDGHRQCNISLSPEQAEKHNNICPVCGRPLTFGVLHRVVELADRKKGFKPEKSAPFKSLIPLNEVLSQVLGKGPLTKTVKQKYDELIRDFGAEFDILLNIDIKEIKKKDNLIAEAISRIREGKIIIAPGYDGVYGKINIFSEKEKKDQGQKNLWGQS